MPSEAHDAGALVLMVAKLMEHWQLDMGHQAALVGLDEAGWAERLQDKVTALDRELAERFSGLLSLHQALRELFPHNPDLRYRWMTAPNRSFGARSPVELVSQCGLDGLHELAEYLKSQGVALAIASSPGGRVVYSTAELPQSLREEIAVRKAAPHCSEFNPEVKG